MGQVLEPGVHFYFMFVENSSCWCITSNDLHAYINFEISFVKLFLIFFCKMSLLSKQSCQNIFYVYCGENVFLIISSRRFPFS